MPDADLLFCTVGWETASGSLISSVSDTLGNTFAALPLVVHSPHQMQGFYAFSNSFRGGHGHGNLYRQWRDLRGHGLWRVVWPHSSGCPGGGHRNTSATPTSASITPSASGELLIGYADDSSNIWAASGAWTLRSTSANVRYGLEDQLSSATAPVAAGFTITSAPWTAGIVAFSSSTDATQNFTLTVVNPVLVAPSITSANNTTFTVGTAGIIHGHRHRFSRTDTV